MGWGAGAGRAGVVVGNGSATQACFQGLGTNVFAEYLCNDKAKLWQEISQIIYYNSCLLSILKIIYGTRPCTGDQRTERTSIVNRRRQLSTYISTELQAFKGSIQRYF
jgi:hypothetical protein